MERETIVILDFGAQYSQLIARRVREAKVYCEILPYSTSVDDIKKKKPCGIIFSGGPASVNAQDALFCDEEIFELGVPILGICYGVQLIAKHFGSTIAHAANPEYGRTAIHYEENNLLFQGITPDGMALMSHFDTIVNLPEGFVSIAKTDNCSNAAIMNEKLKIYGVQFHPEVVHTDEGQEILVNFLKHICGCAAEWTMSSFVEHAIQDIREKVGDKKVLLALSGGVDSSVCAALLSRAIGNQLICVFVDTGMMRKNEAQEVEEAFQGSFDMRFVHVKAEDRFLSKLKGVSEPESKRKIIGEEFIRVFEEEAKKIGHVDFLAQGTIYPDVIESGVGKSAVIKSHHNVGGLPDYVDFDDIIEPLRELFKDEVRMVGEELGLSEELVWRQPFPGPGLAIRCIGEVTKEKLDILREADAIFREEIAKAGLQRKLWQYFAVLTNMRSVGVMGDERTYDYTVALRSVNSNDAMTAEWSKIPYEVLESASSRIVNEVKCVNRIVYDITSKPPATIEWE